MNVPAPESSTPPPESPTDLVRRLMPLAGLLGVEVDRYEADLVAATLAWRPELCTAGGVLHGGALMALADTAGGACAFLNLPDGAAGTTTIESKTNFLGAVRQGRVRAEARPLHVGRTVIVVDTDLHDDGGRLVGRVTQSQLVLGR